MSTEVTTTPVEGSNYLVDIAARIKAEHQAVAASLRQSVQHAIAAGGRGGNAEHREPNKFLLNFMCGAVNTRDEITNGWKRIKTLEEAEQIARDARAAKDPNKVAYGIRNARNRARKPCLVPDTETMSETAKSPDTETMSTGPDTETMSTIDTLTREASVAMHRPKPDRRSKPRLALVQPPSPEIDWNDEWQRYCDELPLFAEPLPAAEMAEAA